MGYLDFEAPLVSSLFVDDMYSGLLARVGTRRGADGPVLSCRFDDSDVNVDTRMVVVVGGTNADAPRCDGDVDIDRARHAVAAIIMTDLFGLLDIIVALLIIVLQELAFTSDLFASRIAQSLRCEDGFLYPR